MAHNLRTNANGEASFAGHNTNAWHELGREVGEAMTSAEAMRLASLDYEVEKVQLFLADGSPAHGAYGVLTSDTKSYLGTVGRKWTPLQNREAFSALDQLVADGLLRFKSAGALGAGEKVWMLAYTPNNVVEIVKGDPIEDYLLFTNDHSGNGCAQLTDTTVTVVCQNTLNMALKGAKPAMQIRHTRSVVERTKMAMQLIAAHAAHKQSWIEAMQYLAKHPITDEIVEAFEIQMFGDLNETPEGRGRTVLRNKLDQFEHLLVNGKGTEIPGRVGNMYGLVQAFTEWVDWESQVKGNEDRTNSIVFNHGAKAKSQALDYALVLAK